MSVRTILTWPDKELRKKSTDLNPADESNVLLAEDLHDTMVVNFGLGIAASQVGIRKNIFVVNADELPDFSEDPKVEKCVVFINPEIEIRNPAEVTSVESCLSVNGITASVKRKMAIKISYFNLLGQKKSVEVSGRQSCILQHEFDHLIGKLFLDRLPSFTKSRIIKKINKQRRDERKNLVDLDSERRKQLSAKRDRLRAERKRRNKNKRKRK